MALGWQKNVRDRNSPMEKISDYILAMGTSRDYKAFEKAVNEKIKAGYQPFGSVFTVPSGQGAHLCQPMIKQTLL